MQLCIIQHALSEGCLSCDPIMRSVSLSMKEKYEKYWGVPLTKSIQQPFKFNLTDPNSDDFTITQGKLFNDYLIAGTEKFYKQLT